MESIIIYNAMWAGIYIALPKGPAGIYVIQQSITHGIKKAAFAALGCIATTIAICLFLLFGVHININSYIMEHQTIVKIILGIASCALGIYFICKDEKVNVSEKKKGWKGLLIGFGITVINPLNLITTSGFMVDAHSGIYQETILNKLLLIMHVVKGSLMVYFIMLFLSWLVMKFVKNLNTRHVNLFFGTIYIFCGIVLFIIIFKPISI